MSHALPTEEGHERETYTVEAFGQFYFARFHKGVPWEVQVRVKRSSGWRDLRTIWSRTGYRMSATPKGRAAEIVAIILNPEVAEKRKATVMDQAMRNAEAERIVAEKRARAEAHLARQIEEGKARDAAKRLADAAPALLEALQGVLRVSDRQTVEYDAARAAIALAIGEGSA